MKQLVNLRTMARCLGISKEWLACETDAGRIPGIKADNDYLFNADAVEQALLQQSAPASSFRNP